MIGFLEVDMYILKLGNKKAINVYFRYSFEYLLGYLA
jgi:hypothetical protein